MSRKNKIISNKPSNHPLNIQDKSAPPICRKGGIQIRDTGNDNAFNPIIEMEKSAFNQRSAVHVPATYDKQSYDNVNLDINSYKMSDLFSLFGITSVNELDEQTMKQCKKIVLKTHPDKSGLDEKYFIFFSVAYKKILGIYEFQNKSKPASNAETEYNKLTDRDKNKLLDNFFDKNKDYKNKTEFNNWFNRQFNKYKLEDPNENGYEDWLKSDEDIVDSGNVTKENMNAEIEKRKKHVQSLITYNGVNDVTSSTHASSLMGNNGNYSSGSLFNSDGMGFTDLRQAYVESVIPVTADDYNNIKKFGSVDEYKRHRENNNNTAPLSKEESMRMLYNENKKNDDQSASLAFYYAKQTEQSKQKNDLFWSEFKQLKN